MTSTPVAGTTNLFSSAASKKSTHANKSGELTKSFTQVMGNAANTSTTTQQFQNSQKNSSVHQPKEVDQSENNSKISGDQKDNDTITGQKRTDKVTKSDVKAKKSDTDISDEMKQELAEKADKLVSEVAEELDVSEDELKKMMEIMGIQAVDLLNPDTMAQLVVKMSGEADMMSLLMDEELYETLTDLMESAKDILQELGEQFQATPEMLSQAMEELKMEAADGLEDVISQENAKESELNFVIADDETKTLEEPVVIVEKEAAVQNKVPERGEATERSEEAVQNENTTNTEAVTETAAANEKTLGADVHHSDPQNKNEQNAHSESGKTFLQGLVEQAAKSAENVIENAAETPFASALGTQDTESIMKQMLDYMKLHLNQNVTEMEMQLKPASLGTINLQMASQNGTITAHFSVQNEGVKEALESQIVQLKENLDERGIKVDSVEVTIASHEFERNLEQGGKQEAQDSGKTGAAKRTNRRKLVLNELEGDTEELEESDKIQVELMQQSGNTVNFTA